MKSKSQIIAEQESIGNVEITEEQFNDWELENKVEVSYREGKYISFLYFAPRDVVYPDEKIGCGKETCVDIFHKSVKCGERYYGEIILCPACQKKKDNHTESGKALAGCRNTKGEPDSVIQTSKIFEDVKKIMDELDTDLVCIDFNRDLSKKDYQIMTAFFNKINKARIKLGLKKIIHTNY
jgi:hypothetical protein